ncbi:ArsR family transcriptional regulator [Celerinatantimonas diazotrophica]|uniref:ArsR family transcriptional regulator n=2 Tax=Celerinatantimonas diazotrophica TaxID=412034 RepID=A0A4R1J8Y6_9GAMM|nr:ArsR family transcriptional regulator [Celerinatantimonas diazotrophica]CAG9295804.1 Transcriptional activator HlyU [Celerinatantimonas diazotrophica]
MSEQDITVSMQEMQENSAAALALLKALANEHRLIILCYLVEHEYSVGALNQCVDLSQSALSQHLAWLRREGIVKTRKQAQTIYYSIASDNAKAILELLHRLYC